MWGSPEEIEYHRKFPDRENVDRRLARFITAKMEGGSGVDSIAKAIYESHFLTSAALALPDMADGVPDAARTELDPDEAAGMIKAYARAIGADDVRIGPLRPEWVYSHRGSRPFFGDGGYVNEPYFTGVPPGYEGAGYGDPVSCDHPTAVSMAFGQEKELIATGSSRAVDFEVGRVYARSVIASVQLARFMRALGWPARAHHLRNYLILCVPVAVDAGVGELARCGYVVSRSLGANFRISTVTTAMPLAHDRPVDIGMQDFCEKCRKCADNCPAGAIAKGEKTVVRGVSKWLIDPEACLQYWGRTGYTCSICASVCPWTKPRNILHRGVAAAAVHLPWLRRALVLGDDVVYGKKPRAKPVPQWLERSPRP